ncbi:MAG TPA: L-seryl-tRNA(Sec) selenium transferase [Vicinamibacterales bacterium]
MSTSDKASLASLPSVDRLLRAAWADALIADHGRPRVTDAIRAVLVELRANGGAAALARANDDSILRLRVTERLDAMTRPSLRPVFNLTGTVVHTNLGRARLAESATAAVALAAAHPSNLEFDLNEGARGDRDAHVEALLCRLTGAAAATVVNNNAAAVLLVLNTLARGEDVPTSRGELVEIGGSFRIPEIMASSGCRLREVGTTNHVHLDDYAAAIGDNTGLVMKVHTSNYAIVGFTSGVSEADLAALCRARGVPFVVDLGSGSLVDLRRYGLPHEPMPSEALAHGADLVTFSGDKLLGGPQAGIIVGDADLIDLIKRNPMKRAMRIDKMTVAALSSTLALYEDPDRLPERLPVLRDLVRPAAEIRAAAGRLRGAVEAALHGMASVEVIECESQFGSGALPTQMIASAGLAIRPLTDRGAGSALNRVAKAFRDLPLPVVGRIHDGALVLDFRCLDDEAAFAAQLSKLDLRAG